MNPWKQVASSWIKAFGLSILSFVIGFFGGRSFIANADASVKTARVTWSQGIGVFIVIFATLSFISWGIQTRGGNSKPEQFNIWAYRVLYVLGTALLVASIGL